MQRPQEREKKQADRAELLVYSSLSLSLPDFLRDLSLHLSTLPLFDPHVCTSTHTTRHALKTQKKYTQKHNCKYTHTFTKRKKRHTPIGFFLSTHNMLLKVSV